MHSSCPPRLGMRLGSLDKHTKGNCYCAGTGLNVECMKIRSLCPLQWVFLTFILHPPCSNIVTEKEKEDNSNISEGTNRWVGELKVKEGRMFSLSNTLKLSSNRRLTWFLTLPSLTIPSICSLLELKHNLVPIKSPYLSYFFPPIGSFRK